MIPIGSVATDSPAYSAGIRSGDSLVELNGKLPTDILDYYFLADDAQIHCVTVKPSGDSSHEYWIQKEIGEPLGLHFSEVVFDNVTECANHCRFCFVDQMPKDLRQTLYVKDDDYRLSMLWGNFITLTNLGHDEIDRIIEQRFSPLYVSLHATDLDVYSDLVRPGKGAAQPFDVLESLLEAELSVHIQIVLCAGFNDGVVLSRTLHDLTVGRFSEVQSVGIVPAGVTRFSPPKSGIRPFRPDEASVVIEQVHAFAKHEKVFLADEFYLLKGDRIPIDAEYQDYPQLENGIGIARQFIDGFRRELQGMSANNSAAVVTLVTGELISSVMNSLIGEFNLKTGANVRVIAVHNQFFGGNVGVAPLLTGQDIMGALSGASGRVLIPDNIFNTDGLTLDGFRIENITDSKNMELIAAPVDGSEFAEFLLRCTAA